MTGPVKAAAPRSAARGVLRLGVRLALGAPGQRWRPLLVALAAVIGVVVVVMVKAEADRRLVDTGYSAGEIGRLKLAIVGAVALPVVVLVASVARVSADLRDRRLANLRLLGLSPGQTRAVSVIESGAAAVLGAVLGAAGSVIAVTLAPADRLDPAFVAVVALAVAAVSVAVASRPGRSSSTADLQRARRAERARPRWWRVVPVLAGLALCLLVGPDDTGDLTGVDVGLLFGGIVALGLGLVLVVPVFVRLTADVMARSASRPATLLAARRLQGQPAAVSRVVAGLMIGLFLISGARCVVAAFETQSVRHAESDLKREQYASVEVPIRQAAGLARAAAGVEGVRSVTTVPIVTGHCDGYLGNRCRILVASCTQIHSAFPDSSDCERGPQWLTGDAQSGGRLRLGTKADEMYVPNPTSVLGGDYGTSAVAKVSPEARYRPLIRHGRRLLVVSAEPGRTLTERLNAVGVQAYPPDFSDYDFYTTLRGVVWSLAAVILAVGLLSFAVTAIDRVVAQRRELVALRLIGTPIGTLRASQFLEAAVPTAAGAVLAIALGLAAGHAYLRVAERATPFAFVGGLTLAATLAALAVAGLTVIATRARLDADSLRTE